MFLFLLQGPGQQTGVGAQGPLPVLPRQLPRLPAGLEYLQGGQQPQRHPIAQAHPLPLG